MRRIVALVAIALAAVFIGVAGVPATPAHALQCTNSLTCNSANAPLLAEAGLVNIGGKGAVAPVTQSAGANMASVQMNAAAGGLIGTVAGMLGLTLGLFGQNGGTATVNPEYVNEEHQDCSGGTPALPVLSVQPTCDRLILHYRPGTQYQTDGYMIVSGSVQTVGPDVMVTVTALRDGYTAPPSGQAKTASNTSGAITSRCINRTSGAVSALASQSFHAYTHGQEYTRTFTCPTATHDWQVSVAHDKFSANGLANSVIGNSQVGFYANTGTANISGQVRTRVECMPHAGGSNYYVQNTVDFAITVSEQVPIPEAFCYPGDLALSSTVEWMPTGRPSWESIGTAEAPSTIETWTQDFPLCYGTAPVICELTLHRIATGGALESCGQYGALCEGWATGTKSAIESRYECHFGPYTVGIDYCSGFRAFSTHGVLPNVDEDGVVIPVTAPPPTTVPGKTVTPEQVQEAGWGEYIDTEGGKQSECWPSGWGVLNPLSWVYMPLTCAMEWAFVPRTSVITQQLATLTTTWQATALGKLQTTLTAWAFVPPAGGCNGITVSVWFLGPPFQVMDACPGSILAPLATWSRFFGNVAFTVYGAIAVTRHIARIVGYEGIGRSGE